MTGNVDPLPEPELPPEPPVAGTSEQDSKRKPKRPRRRKIFKWFLILLGVMVVLRIAIQIALPIIVEQVASSLDLEVEYEDLDLSILGADVELWHLVVRPAEGGEEIAHVEYLRADLSVFDLLSGDIVVRRLEVDGLDVALTRNPDGSISPLDRFKGSDTEEESPEEEAPEEEDEDRGPLDLSPPLRIDAARIQHLKARIRDEMQDPPFETELNLTLRLSDFGSRTRPARVDLDLAMDGVLDALRLEVTARLPGERIEAEVGVHLAGLLTAPLMPVLDLIGIQPVASSLDLDLRAALSAEPGEEDGQLSVSAEVTELVVRADEEEAVGVQRVFFEVPELGAGRIRVSRAVVQGVRARAEVLPSGAFRAGGLDFLPADGEEEEGEDPEEDGEPTVLLFEDIRVEDVRAELLDGTVTPPQPLVAVITLLEAKDLAPPPRESDSPLTISGSFSLPGLAEHFELSGQADPFADEMWADLRLSFTGISPSTAKPYLAGSGIELLPKDGELHFDLEARCAIPADGPLTGRVKLTELVLADGGELLGIDEVEVTGFLLAEDGSLLHADSVTVGGIRLPARLHADGAFDLAGMRFGAAEPAGAPPETDAEPPAGEPAPESDEPGMRFEAGRIVVGATELNFGDGTVSPEALLGVRDLAVELRNFSLGGEVAPTDVSISLSAPGLIEGLEITGNVAPGPEAITGELHAVLSGITGAAAEPYLAAAGIESMFVDGRLELTARGEVRTVDGLAIQGSLSEVSLRDGETEHVALDLVELVGIQFAPGRTEVGSMAVEGGRLRARREADGALRAAGLRILPSPDGEAGAPPPESGSPAARSVTVLTRVRVEALELAWGDDRVDPPLEVDVGVDAEVMNLRIGEEAEESAFNLTVRAPGTVRSLTAEGSMALTPSRTGMSVDLTVEGIQSGVISSYLPPGVTLELRDGSLAARIAAETRPNEEGGDRMSLVISRLLLREEAEDRDLLSVPRLVATAERLDLDAGLIEIDEMTLSGIEGDVERAENGDLLALGFRVASLPEGPPPPSVPEKEVVKTRGGLEIHEHQPLITAESLSLGIKRLTYRDAALGGTEPIVIEKLLFEKTGLLQLLGEDSDTQPPMEFRLTGRIAPFTESFEIEGLIAPFASEPEARLDFNLHGLNGPALGRALPGLTSRLDATEVKDGELHAEVRAVLISRRRHALDFDLSHGFGAELQVTDLEFREGDDGPLRFGVADIFCQATKIDPRTGSVHLKALEIVGAQGSLIREEKGLRFGGILLPTPPGEEEAATSDPAESVVAGEPEAESPGPPSAEFRVDALQVLGLDFTYADLALDPPFRLPIKELDLEVKGFSTRAFESEIPVRFRFTCRSAEIALPVEGGREAPPFAELSATGRLSFSPKFVGWARLSAAAVELSNFRGLAGTSGVKLNEGVLDTGADLRFGRDGELEVQTRATFTDLDLSEPPDGPISRYLKLPAPLNVVIYVLRDRSGAIQIPLDFAVPSDGVGTGQAARMALKTLSQLIVRAVAASPFRVVSNVTELPGVSDLIGVGGSLLGLGGEEKEYEPLSAEFAVGAIQSNRSTRETVARTAEILDDEDDMVVTVVHELGLGDLELVRHRANPTPEDARQLASSLRRRKLEVLREHARAVEQARAFYASGRTNEAEAAALRIRALDREAGLTEQALDRVIAILRPGAERQAARRTREAAVILGNLRLMEIRDQLTAAGVKSVGDRVRYQRMRYEVPEREGGGRVVLVFSREQQSE